MFGDELDPCQGGMMGPGHSFATPQGCKPCLILSTDIKESCSVLHVKLISCQDFTQPQVITMDVSKPYTKHKHLWCKEPFVFLMTRRITHLPLDLTPAGAICWKAEMKRIRSQIGMAGKSEDIRFRDDHIFRVRGPLCLSALLTFFPWLSGWLQLSVRKMTSWVCPPREQACYVGTSLIYPQSCSFQSCLLKVTCLKTSILSRHPSCLVWLKVEASSSGGFLSSPAWGMHNHSSDEFSSFCFPWNLFVQLCLLFLFFCILSEEDGEFA